MVNSVLRKLSDPKRSELEIADLLAKHIGNGSSEWHCEEACKELRRIRNEKVRAVAELIWRVQTSNGFSACDVVRQVIAALREPTWSE